MNFNIGTVVSAMSGRLFCDIGDLYKILSFMTGDEIYTHQIPRAIPPCKIELNKQFPSLAIEKIPEFNTAGDMKCQIDTWLLTLQAIYGATLNVEPLSVPYEQKDPLAELYEMMNSK